MKDHIAYCGLDCETCRAHTATANNDDELRKQVAKQWHKPIFVNSQADENTSKKSGPKLSDIKYTQAIGQDSDNVLSLYRDAVMINDREMGIGVLKQREGTLGKVLINWDFQHMNFKGIYSDTEDSVDDEEEANEKVIGIE